MFHSFGTVQSPQIVPVGTSLITKSETSDCKIEKVSLTQFPVRLLQIANNFFAKLKILPSI